MDYFIMKTDKRLRRLPQLLADEAFFFRKKTRTPIVYVKEYGGLSIEYADYLEDPVPLIADKFQKILQKYQPDMALLRVMLIEKESGRQKAYCLMQPPEILCADREKSRYDAKGVLQDFVLDAKQAGNRSIFLAKDYNRQLVVRLDAAESILRREPNGIWFEPVHTAERSE